MRFTHGAKKPIITVFSSLCVNRRLCRVLSYKQEATGSSPVPRSRYGACFRLAPLFLFVGLGLAWACNHRKCSSIVVAIAYCSPLASSSILLCVFVSLLFSGKISSVKSTDARSVAFVTWAYMPTVVDQLV